MGYIVESIVGDRAIQLGNEDFARTMSMGTQWQKIRIGFLNSVWNTGGSITGRTVALGVCQGVDHTYGDPSCTDFIGVIWPGVAQGGGHYQSANYITVAQRTGVAETSAHDNNNPNMFLSAAPGSVRFPFIVDILKGPVNYTLYYYAPGVSSLVDVSTSTFLSYMENESFVTQPPISLAYSGAGLFDSVCLSWHRSVPTVEVSDLCVVRFY